MTESYVYLQVRKNGNHSDVDALIHKVIPKIDIENSRRKINRRINTKSNLEEQLKDLESLVLAIHTGVNGNLEPIKPNVAQNIQNFVKNIIENENVKALFRSNKRSYNIKPEIVHFKSDKPSLMLEVSFESIVNAIDEILRSKKVKDYADTLGHNAAIIYRTLLDESRKHGKTQRKSL
ncbi:hypothetical protein RR46_07099 [Papilio xuthus]|uniref:Uncharacterized protein n=1 Tax=Papilio xuthus TaxID=66420 RepID=A0A194Q575_PAPXU|nr:hypothetical protein RR46_07099 [Papilio xuthus]